VRSIARDAARNNYRITSLVTGIVRSTPFALRKSPEPEPAPAVAIVR
jgi:hypothetical protein